ncbi:MAG: hypothetical protein HYR86_03430 [Candidatus Rokubacteria bacterium]|nr:hypothetical protein [Candidatus Rokubacteria bacterium]
MKALDVGYGRVLLLLLVGFTVAVLLGHICALPAFGEWKPAGSNGRHPAGDEHDGGAGHVASCDATVSKASPPDPQASDTSSPASAPTVASTGSAPAREVMPPARRTPSRAPSRAVFLLNASFLI